MTGAALIAHQDVRAAFNHIAGAAAMPVDIVQPVRRQIVDEHRLAAAHGYPGIGTAAMRMNAGIGHSQGREIVGAHVRRSGFGRADADVGAARAFVVIVGRHPGIVAQPRLGLHCMLENIITRRAERGVFWL